MNCFEIEVLICEYVDGALAPVKRAEVESHLAECPACAGLARDSTAAVGFIERAAEVDPPPKLITRILFDAPWQKARTGWFPKTFHSVLQPKFAMSMALTIFFLFDVVGPGPACQPCRSPTHLGLGRIGEPGLPGLGPHREVLRQPEVRVSDSNHPEGMAAGSGSASTGSRFGRAIE